MAALIAGLAGQAGQTQQQMIAGGFNSLNTWQQTRAQQEIARMNNEQQKWNFQNREKAYTDAGLPAFLSYQGGNNDLGGMVPQTYSHLGGMSYQRTGVLGGSFRGLSGSPIEQMFGFGRDPSTRVPYPGLRRDEPPSYDSVAHDSYPRYGYDPMTGKQRLMGFRNGIAGFKE